MVSCHTHPNDRLLQLPVTTAIDKNGVVVIPILTIGFYNERDENDEPKEFSCHTHPNDRLLQPTKIIMFTSIVISCHTHPNDRLLQQSVNLSSRAKKTVVIPILTIGFYNL